MKHATKEMDAWIRDEEKVLEGAMGAVVVPASYDEDGVPGSDEIDDGVEGDILFGRPCRSCLI